MKRFVYIKSVLAGGTSVLALTSAAFGANFNVPSGDLEVALNTYATQAGVRLVVSDKAVKGARTRGAKGELTAVAALSRILEGTGFSPHPTSSGAIVVARDAFESAGARRAEDIVAAQAETRIAAASSAGIESVVVTSSKIKGDIQTVPIAITALSQEQLTSRQIAGGPDLVKEVPNLTFSKTNFTGYNIQIRGIGTQAISVTTDPAVAVAFNDTPFIRNHFFEQEFYDLSQAEVLRGPQGTLYGRNATAGVVNIVSAKPTDQFEAMLSADWGNYTNRRYEGMVNIPIIGDTLDLRVAGEWTKRNGYSFNALTNAPIDGRDLWSTRVTLGWKPASNIQTYLIWEHFNEGDDRLRSGKQLCKRDNGPATVLGQSTAVGPDGQMGQEFLGQGCLPGSLYSPSAFGVPNALSLPYYGGFLGAGFGQSIGNALDFDGGLRDAYASTTQSTNLRVIESALTPHYKAKNDTLEFNAEWQAAPWLTVNSETGYNRDFLWSIEDYNRFNTQPGIFNALFGSLPPSEQGLPSSFLSPDGNYRCLNGSLAIGMTCSAAGLNSYPGELGTPTAYFCDPQLGCSNRLVGEDLSDEHSWQLSQEFRMASNFSGPFNFSLGGNYLHYETEENYYVFINTVTMYSASDNSSCLNNGYQYANPQVPSNPENCLGYIDPNPIGSLNNEGHNYFLSQNPYVLNSYAGFGEVYYNVTPDLKLTGGLRWTVDQKHFIDIPSELLTDGYGYPVTGVVNQKWSEWTGRSVLNWTPKLDFTDQTLVYGSYAHGYKAGGANPPGAVLLSFKDSDIVNPVHPLTFKPEHIDAYEAGTKNTLLDGGLTLNGDVFFYNYTGYQISEIVDRTAINLNFNATVKGAELEASWEPVPGLKFNLAGGYEDTRIGNGQSAVDLMDRTAGNPNWILVKPFPTQASNCVLPAYVVAYMLENNSYSVPGLCGIAYAQHFDPVTAQPYAAISGGGYPGFDPLAGTPGDPYTGQNIYNGVDYGPAPNNGQGFDKNLSGNQLPNAPHFTTFLSADYTLPVSADWAATLHSDFYWQSQSFARVFNDRPYDKIRGYSNVNAALILTDASGWQVMGYVKNIFNATAITGDFLNSDDSGLTTNVFLTDPRLYGIRVTKHFDDGGSGSGVDFFDNSDADDKRPQIWLQLGGDFTQLDNAQQHYSPSFTGLIPDTLLSPFKAEKAPATAFDSEAELSYQPEDTDWVLKAGIRYGRSATHKHIHHSLPAPTATALVIPSYGTIACTVLAGFVSHSAATFCPLRGHDHEFVDAQANSSEQHTMLDFTLGKDVGVGTFGDAGTSTIGGGVRLAQFTAHAAAEINSDPDYTFNNPKYFGRYYHHHVFDGTTREKRSFHGIGPELTWDASQPILGNAGEGQIAFDWGLNGAVLFGRQRVNIHHKTSAEYCGPVNGFGQVTNGCNPISTQTPAISRSCSVMVPNLGGYVGLSVLYNDAKVSFGYRADEFFGAMDGGQGTAKNYNRGFFGPYLNLSLGFGG